nr:MAG TPA: hypothetical protein [Caudoviricetes sp.]
MGWAPIETKGKPWQFFKHSVNQMKKQNETDNQRHESTIDKYFDRTADGYKAWAEEDEEERFYLQIASETTGDADEDGNQGFDFHIAYHGKTSFLADGIAQTMQRDEFLRTIVIEAARKFLMDK